ncbi:putative serine/threonine protein kinase [Tribonema minus]|uniref:Putative serine/threonine protein kinase n=1 Tax=Tribonema minus TaxID=303371 RepID=A0A835YQV9_9STRA|nr:putative serine/threonine protein kinase [Tribonema minus]
MLGNGSSGEVVLVHETEHPENLFAIKIISLKYIHRNHLSTQIKREISVMKSLHHDNIVRLYRVLKGGTKLYLVCEYVSGGDLYDKIANLTSLPEPLACKYFVQIVKAIQHCHDNGITHRDLKPENCMVTDDGEKIKVTDFGLSNITSQKYGDMFFTVCGTPHYASPECPRDTVSVEAEDLIRSIIVVDPTKRPSLEQILAHKWIADNSASDDEFSPHESAH